MAAFGINQGRLLARLEQLGRIGADSRGGRTRLALTAEDKAGRDLIVTWLQEIGAQVHVDRIGNIFGVISDERDIEPLMIGSHIDTVVRAGALDGCYGVVAGIEVLQVLKEHGVRMQRPVAVAAFTNEEGVRFMPDLLGSRVVVKDVELETALAISATDGATVAQELQHIGYDGRSSPWEVLPGMFIELHIEQGPVLDSEGIAIGIVEAVQGHSWWRVRIEGVANHAGTTPMSMRRDAGAAAMTLATRIVEQARDRGVPNVATVGTIAFEPNAINVVPGSATFTVDLRDHRDQTLRAAEQWLHDGVRELQSAGFRSSAQLLSHHAPVSFDADLCALLDSEAATLGLTRRRMNSGASHDAQMMARLCPTAMIFVPSQGGISHNPREHTEPAALKAGAQLLLRAALRLAGPTGGAQ